jgi:hypothetical protein
VDITSYKQFKSATLSAILLTMGLTTINPVHGSENEEDFTALNLEDLMQISLVRNATTALTSHIHKKGDWMVGYHSMFMKMEDNRDGTSNVRVPEVLADFMVAPLSMDMDMHMFHVMYAPSDDVTLMLMANYQDNSMDHVTRMGMKFTTESSGMGDTSLIANYVVNRAPGNKQLFSVKGGISIPTGSIDEKDMTPAGRVRLPYPMQLGSGTYDVILGADYQRYEDLWSIGIGGTATIRTSENDNDYTLGDVLELEAWYSRGWTDSFTTSVKLLGSSWDNIDGADPELNPMMVPTADPNRRGGKRIDLLIDLELYAPNGKLQGNRLGVEFGVPIYEDLDGPQLSVDWTVMLGWQWVF